MKQNLLAWLAAFVVAAAPTYLIRFSIFGIPTTLLELLIYFFVLAVVLVHRPWFSLFNPLANGNHRLVWPIILFLAATFLSTAIAPDKQVALGILKGWIIDPLLFVWALWQIPDREKITSAVVTGMVTGGLFVALVAIIQRVTGQLTVDGRVVGPYAWSPVENPSPNYLALYLGPIAVLAFGFALGRWQELGGMSNEQKTTNKLMFIAYCSLFILMSLAILFSYSRGGLAAVGIGMVTVIVLQSWSWIRKHLWAKTVFLGLVILGFIAATLYIRPNPALSPEEGGRITASNNVRWEIWKTTVKEVIPAEPLFGVGLGNFQEYFTELTVGRVNYDRIAPLALTPHNFFLAVWVNLGLLGLIAFLWLLFEFFRSGFRILKNSFSPALMSSMLALLAHGLLDTPYFKNDLSLLFWTLVALMVMWSEERVPLSRKSKE